MKITVAICTWNRADLLDMTLRQMLAMRVPDRLEWELLVVNNRCTDATDEVIAHYQDKLPLCRLFEERQGHSAARNCAIAAARGDLIVWTDDDVLVDCGWLEAYHAAALRWPDATYFGGVVDPLYEGTPPAWVHRHPGLIGGPFALRQLGGEERPFAPGERPFGANMAFRMAALEGIRFDPFLGRVAEQLISGDETQLLERLRARGDQGIWVGPARVLHFVPRRRQTIKYIWDFWSGIGRTEVRQQGIPQGKLLFGAPRWALRQYWSARAVASLRALLRDRKWAEAFKRAAYVEGVLAEIKVHRARGSVTAAAKEVVQRIGGAA